MNLSIIASTLDPVSTIPRSAAMNPYNSTFSQSVVPTHTFSTAPDLEVLLVPGGIGTIAPDRNTTVAYIKKAFPKLRYLITVCTGAHLAAEAYVLDGKNVTTTKRSWAKVKTLGKNTHWIAPARWVVDGNIWTGSGLSSGLDVIFAWIGAVYGEDVSNGIAISMEYERTTNSTADPFSALYNATSVIGNRA
jgi:transcriptional regulator GlxA family with amidase domain